MHRGTSRRSSKRPAETPKGSRRVTSTQYMTVLELAPMDALCPITEGRIYVCIYASSRTK
jgi:hypothetical protein